MRRILHTSMSELMIPETNQSTACIIAVGKCSIFTTSWGTGRSATVPFITPVCPKMICACIFLVSRRTCLDRSAILIAETFAKLQAAVFKFINRKAIRVLLVVSVYTLWRCILCSPFTEIDRKRLSSSPSLLARTMFVCIWIYETLALSKFNFCVPNPLS